MTTVAIGDAQAVASIALSSGFAMRTAVRSPRLKPACFG
jgi:hypothetical protein